jgi:hypothetical protein
MDVFALNVPRTSVKDELDKVLDAIERYIFLELVSGTSVQKFIRG